MQQTTLESDLEESLEVATTYQHVATSSDFPADFSAPLTQWPWYGVRTRSNQERVVTDVLNAKGYDAYVPAYRVERKRGNKVVSIELPLFSGYVFCRFDPSKRFPILITPGVVSVVSFGNGPTPIPDEEIQAIRTVLRSGLPAQPHAYLFAGQRVRVNDGPMRGVEGVLLKQRSECRLVVSVNLLQRSVAVELDNHTVCAVEHLPR